MCQEETDFHLLWAPPTFHLAGGPRRLSWGPEKKKYVVRCATFRPRHLALISYTHTHLILILYTLLLRLKA